MVENVHFEPLGPLGPSKKILFFMRVVIIFGLEMLALVNFDNRKYYFLFKQEQINFSQIVPGAKLSAVPNRPFYITVPNCPRC